MKKCAYCCLRDSKPCYECSACEGGDDHFKYDSTLTERIEKMIIERGHPEEIEISIDINSDIEKKAQEKINSAMGVPKELLGL